MLAKKWTLKQQNDSKIGVNTELALRVSKRKVRVRDDVWGYKT